MDQEADGPVTRQEFRQEMTVFGRKGAALTILAAMAKRLMIAFVGAGIGSLGGLLIAYLGAGNSALIVGAIMGAVVPLLVLGPPGR